jgi:hypothetical protein
MLECLLPVGDPESGFCFRCKTRNFPIGPGRTGHGHRVLTVLLNPDDVACLPFHLSIPFLSSAYTHVSTLSAVRYPKQSGSRRLITVDLRPDVSVPQKSPQMRKRDRIRTRHQTDADLQKRGKLFRGKILEHGRTLGPFEASRYVDLDLAGLNHDNGFRAGFLHLGRWRPDRSDAKPNIPAIAADRNRLTVLWGWRCNHIAQPAVQEAVRELRVYAVCHAYRLLLRAV